MKKQNVLLAFLIVYFCFFVSCPVYPQTIPLKSLKVGDKFYFKNDTGKILTVHSLYSNCLYYTGSGSYVKSTRPFYKYSTKVNRLRIPQQ